MSLKMHFITTVPPTLAHFATPLKFGRVLSLSLVTHMQLYLKEAPSKLIQTTPADRAALIGIIFFGIWVSLYARVSQSDPDFLTKYTQMLTANSFSEYFSLKNVPGDGSCFYHAIARQMGDDAITDQTLRNTVADAIYEKFQQHFASGKTISAGAFFASSKVANGDEGDMSVTQLRTELQDNGIVREGEDITQTQFHQYIKQIRDNEGFKSWGSDFHAKYLAKELKATIHIVRPTRSFFDLSGLMSLFFDMQQQSVKSSYCRTVHGKGTNPIYIFHSGGNHYQILQIKKGNPTETIQIVSEGG